MQLGMCFIDIQTVYFQSRHQKAPDVVMVWLDSTAVTRQLCENHQERVFGSAQMLGVRSTCFIGQKLCSCPQKMLTLHTALIILFIQLFELELSGTHMQL